MTNEHPQFAVVVWEDAWCDSTEAVTLKDASEKHRPATFQTTGWLLVSDEKGISIANERCLDKGEESYRGRTFIPRPLVRSTTLTNLSPKRKARHAKNPTNKPVGASNVPGGDNPRDGEQA